MEQTPENSDFDIPGMGGDMVPAEPPADPAAPDISGVSEAPEMMSFDDLPDPPVDEPPRHDRRSGDRRAADRPGSLDAVLDVPVRVQAVLGRARMPIAELVAMRPGYVVELDRRVGEAIDLLVNNRLIARGEIVMIDGALGVTLTEIVRQEA